MMCSDQIVQVFSQAGYHIMPSSRGRMLAPRGRRAADGGPSPMNQLRVWQALLPTLASRQEAPNQWLAYLDRVYGLETLEWPLDLSKLTFFYPEVPLLQARLRALVPLLGRSDASLNRSIAAGELMTPPGKRRLGISGREYLDVYHLYHPPYPEGAVSTIWIYPYAGKVFKVESVDDIDDNIVPVRSQSKVEVLHCSDGGDTPAYSMYRAQGSGVFFNVGRTFVARNRCELWAAAKLPDELPSAFDDAFAAMARMSVGVRPRCRLLDTASGAWSNRTARRTFGDLRRADCPGYTCDGAYGAPRDVWQQGQLLTEAALRELVRRGYESVQLSHTEEHAIHKFEIFDLRQHVMPPSAAAGSSGAATTKGLLRPHSCPRGAKAAQHYYQGWGGAVPCGCNASARILAGQPRACIRCSPETREKHLRAAAALAAAPRGALPADDDDSGVPLDKSSVQRARLGSAGGTVTGAVGGKATGAAGGKDTGAAGGKATGAAVVGVSQPSMGSKSFSFRGASDAEIEAFIASVSQAPNGRGRRMQETRPWRRRRRRS